MRARPAVFWWRRKHGKASYGGDVTAAGAPSEELLDSAEREVTPVPRPWILPLVVILLAAVGVFGFQTLQPDPITEPRQTSPTSQPAAADPSLVDASARRLYGEIEPTGAQSFSSAVRAATEVVQALCRTDIPSWAASLVSSDDSYDRAVFLMSPANRAFGTFVVQVELSWTVDHFSYAAVAGHVERCV